MKWYYLNTGAGTGKFNMDFDQRLCSLSKEENSFFRLYRWEPYCISLGANQDIKSVDTGRASNDGIDTVYRPTGGRAILHSEELTYSVIIPTGEIKSAKSIYHQINLALTEGLKLYNEKLAKVELENEQPDLQGFYKTTQGNICFAVPAKSELKYEGKKLVGSAQRKLNNVILQHGSILCGKFHRNITSYLHLSVEEKSFIESEMESKTTEIQSILREEVDYEKLSLSLLAGFEHYFNTDFEWKDYSELLSLEEENII